MSFLQRAYITIMSLPFHRQYQYYCLWNVVALMLCVQVFVFSLQNNQSVWSKYCWGKITSIVSVGYMSTDLMCLAHRHKSRVIAIGEYIMCLLCQLHNAVHPIVGCFLFVGTLQWQLMCYPTLWANLELSDDDNWYLM